MLNFFFLFLNLLYNKRYPLDNGDSTEDDDLLYDLAHAYSVAHPTMHVGEPCDDKAMTGGISRGSDWHRTLNTLQDYVYQKYNSYMVRFL